MIKIRGYAAVFNKVIRTEDHPAFVLPRGSLDSVPGRTIPLWIDHDGERAFASTRNGALRIWPDAFGLAFEGQITDRWLEDQIRSGRRAECSCSFREFSQPREGMFGNERVRFFDQAAVDEISLVAVGACPGTACWTEDTPRSHMTDGQRFAAGMRAMNSRRPQDAAAPSARGAGSDMARSSYRSRAASTKTLRQVPASVVAVLAAYEAHRGQVRE